MIAQERTRQQLDPIGTFGSGWGTIALAISAFAVAVTMTLDEFDQLANPTLAVFALLVVGAACGFLVYESSPFRAPFSRRSHYLVIGSTLLAVAAHVFAEWPALGYIRHDWGPVALGLLFLAIGPYRPPRELVTSGCVVAVFVGFLAVVQGNYADSGIPALAIVAVAVMPILALSFAAAAYGNGIVSGLEHWHRALLRPGLVVSKDDEDGIARSVQQDRVTILNREVLPFFLSIIDKTAVSNGDRERARDIANSIRGVMVAEVDRSWLRQALDRAGDTEPLGTGGQQAQSTLHDDDHIANLMTYDQRTALRAFLVAVHEIPGYVPDNITIELFRDTAVCRGVIVVAVEIADKTLRSRFAPYFAVLRVMFADLRLEYLRGALTLSFSYEQR